MALKPSPRLALLLLLSHAIAAWIVYLTALPAPVGPAMQVLILVSLLYYLARDVLLLLPGSWREVLPDRNGISVVTRDGSRLAGRAAARTFVSPHFTVLHISAEGRRRTVARLIFPDALDKDAFRELSVYLRFAQ